MIKYLELTAPESSEYRQAKILKVLVAEGDLVEAGDPLFRVKSGSNEIDLPARLAGKVVEVIVMADENISVMTPLLLLETEVEGSTATPPIVEEGTDDGSSPSPTKQDQAEESTDNSTPVTAAVKKKAKKAKKVTKKKSKKVSKKKGDKTSKKKAAKKKANRSKQHSQQLLDLDGSQANDTEADDSPEFDDSPELELVESPETINEPELEISTTDKENIVSESNQNSGTNIQVAVPDIGSDSAQVIEILVAVGDSVEVDDPLVTLESDKASMDVPSTHAGVISAISVSVDQEISEGTVIVELTSDSAAPDAEAPAVAEKAQAEAAEAPAEAPAAAPATEAASVVDVVIPDIGGDSAKVIEILVEVGQEVAEEDPLVTLESDKASMEVPSSHAGTIQSIEVSLDQDVNEGVVVVKLLGSSGAASHTEAAPAKAETTTPSPAAAPAAPAAAPTAAPVAAPQATTSDGAQSHASPSIRRFARELGADLSKIKGSGRKARITKDDVKTFVKGIMTGGASSAGAAESGGAGIPPVPAQDFSKFGEIDVQPLNRIKRLTASNLHRSWLNVPHVTHNDESNINDLESFRKQLNDQYAKQKKNIKLSPLAFIVKAVVNALQEYPQFNSSLEPGGENLIYKKYFNIGIAVETPNGLVVPVIKDADKMSVAEIAQSMGELAAKARDKKLTTQDMTGGCFTISSLGGIGGTHFTPIVNAPEVAILGVSRGKMQPVWNGSEFEPGMILPLSLSYDHRVIDGAEAARFTRQIAAVLEDVRLLAV